MRQTLASTVGVLLLLTALTACGTASDGAESAQDCTPAHPGISTVRPGTLTVATYNFPPFLVVEGTTVSGIEGDILRNIAEMECLSLTSQPLDTASVIPATQNGRTDVSAGDWYCTSARAQVLSLAGPVFSDQIVIVSNDGATTFMSCKVSRSVRSTATCGTKSCRKCSGRACGSIPIPLRYITI